MMRDITITTERMRGEARIFGLCGGVALSVNALSILFYDTSWIELVTTLHVTFALAVAFYFGSVAGRGLIGVARGLRSTQKRRR